MCIERYKSKENFLALYHPSKQYAYTRDLRRVFTGGAPTLATISRAFGEQTSIAWLALQLIDLSETSACKDKLTTYQLDSISKVILATWGYLKASEIMLFFMRLKSGEYGKIYGAIDCTMLTEALQRFTRERDEQLARFQREDEARQKAEEDARHDAEVQAFRDALAVSNMTMQEWAKISGHRLTLEEITEIGWLLK